MGMEDIKLQDVGSLLGSLGTLASAVNPMIGGGMVLAGKAIEKLNQLDDEMLETEFVGLSQMATEIKRMIEAKEFDSEKLQYIADSLLSLSVGLNKFFKMVG